MPVYLDAASSTPLSDAARAAVEAALDAFGDPLHIHAEGRVAWQDRRVGMGVQFEAVDPAQQTLIDNFVDAHFFSNRKA